MKNRTAAQEVKLAEVYFGYKYSGIGGIFYLHRFPRARWVELAIFIQGIILFITSTSAHRTNNEVVYAYEIVLLLLFFILIILLGIMIRLDMRLMKGYFLKYRSNFPVIE